MGQNPRMIYAYARVSTDGQSVAAQIKELRDAGAEKIFRETASGAKNDRAQLRRALAALAADDVLLVTRLDRLARSTRDLLNTLAAIAAKGAREGKRREARPQANSDAAPAAGGEAPDQGAQGVGWRNCAELQCKLMDNSEDRPE